MRRRGRRCPIEHSGRPPADEPHPEGPHSDGLSSAAAAAVRARLDDLHAQLRGGGGRLSVRTLADHWNCSPTEVLQQLSELRSRGLLERQEEAPYFRITSRGQRVRQ